MHPAHERYGVEPSCPETMWPQRMKRWSLAPPFRSRVDTVMRRLSDNGWQPELVSAWRSLDSQKQLEDLGYTQLQFGLHNAVNDEGYPAALAADIVDTRHRWGTEELEDGRRVPSIRAVHEAHAFFADLQRIAEEEGLFVGTEWEVGHEPFWRRLGWTFDPAHIQGVPDYQLSSIRRDSLRALYPNGGQVPLSRKPVPPPHPEQPSSTVRGTPRAGAGGSLMVAGLLASAAVLMARAR